MSEKTRALAPQANFEPIAERFLAVLGESPIGCDVDGCDDVAESVIAAHQRLLVPGTGVIAVRCWFFVCIGHRSVVAASLGSSSEAWKAEYARQASILAAGG